MRHAGVVPGLPRVATKDVTVQDGARGPIHVKSGSTILVATSSAAMDPVAFPNPEMLDPHRPFKDYSLLGHGLHFCFGSRMVGGSLAATLREVFNRVVIDKYIDLYRQSISYRPISISHSISTIPIPIQPKLEQP
jgi:cytochrome P450